MSDETENENRRRIDKMEGDFEKSEIRREKDNEIQEEKMEAMKSDLSEKLADFKTAAADLRAAAAEDRTAAERRDKEMHKFISFTVFGAAGLVIAFMGVGLAFLNISLRSVGAG